MFCRLIVDRISVKNTFIEDNSYDVGRVKNIHSDLLEPNSRGLNVGDQIPDYKIPIAHTIMNYKALQHIFALVNEQF